MPNAIWLVDGDPAGVGLIVEAFGHGNLKDHSTVASDGREALALWRGFLPRWEVEHSDLTLRALNRAGQNGRKALAVLKYHPELTHILLQLPTRSKTEDEIRRAYAEPANCSVTQAVALASAIRSIKGFGAFFARLAWRDTHGCKFNSNTAHRG